VPTASVLCSELLTAESMKPEIGEISIEPKQFMVILMHFIV